jgi:hypothetical protein
VRDDVISDGANARTASQVHQRHLRVDELVWMFREAVHPHSEELGTTLAICDEPRLHGMYGDPEAEVPGRRGHHPADQLSCTRSVSIQVSQDEPWSQPGGVVEARQLAIQVLLASQPVHHP